MPSRVTQPGLVAPPGADDRNSLEKATVEPAQAWSGYDIDRRRHTAGAAPDERGNLTVTN